MNIHLTDPNSIYNIFKGQMTKATQNHIASVNLKVGQKYLSKKTGYTIEIKTISLRMNRVMTHSVKTTVNDPEMADSYNSSQYLNLFIEGIKEGTFTLIN